MLENFMMRLVAALQALDAWRDRRTQAKRERFIVYKLKTQWIYSGVMRGPSGFNSDLGFHRSEERMNRRQALKFMRKNFEGASLLHCDDRNKIITYVVTGN